MNVWTYRLKLSAVIHRLQFRGRWSAKAEELMLEPETPCGLSQGVLVEAARMEKLVVRPIEDVTCKVCKRTLPHLDDQVEGVIRDRMIALRISRDERFKEMLAFYDDGSLRDPECILVLADWMEERGFSECHLLRYIVCAAGPVDYFVSEMASGPWFLNF